MTITPVLAAALSTLAIVTPIASPGLFGHPRQESRVEAEPGGLVVVCRVVGRDAVSMDDLIRSVEVLERRVASLGLEGAEVELVERDDETRILVTAPEARSSEAAHLRRLIESPGSLEFRLCAQAGPDLDLEQQRERLELELQRLRTAGEPAGRTADLHALTAELGDDRVRLRWIPVAERSTFDWCRWNFVDYEAGRVYFELVEIDPENEFSEASIAEFSAATDGGSGLPAVGFRLEAPHADRFAKFTRDHLDRKLSIVLDGQVLMSPKIVGEITTHGVITGGTEGFTRQEVDTLIARLENGRLSVEIEVLSVNERGQ